MLEVLRNVTLLDRPIRIAAVVSSIRAAIRGRLRQYELRDVLVALHTARESAERANRLKDEFLATLSHELRTPLNAVLGWVAMLRHSQVEPPRIPGVLETIERNAQAQAQLIADVLDVSRIITGRLRLTIGSVRVAQVIENAAETARPAANAKHIDLRIESAEDLPTILGDADRLQQVVWNLVSNAVKFTPAGGRSSSRPSRPIRKSRLPYATPVVGSRPSFCRSRSIDSGRPTRALLACTVGSVWALRSSSIS